MVQTKLTLLGCVAHSKANSSHKFTKESLKPGNVNTVGHIGFGYLRLFWQLESSDEVFEVEKQLRFKSDKSMWSSFRKTWT